jgi:type IV pilus assembly protein PilY1
MKRHLKNNSATRNLLALALTASLALPLPSQASLVNLATSPLATSTTSTVQPNLLLVLDNSGSMDWDHMPDDSSDGGSSVTFSYGYYGLRSNQCNEIYYDPSYTYLPPVDSSGTPYSDASFTSAWTDGFNTGSGTVNLDTSFRASQSLNGDSAGQSAYYYSYSGIVNGVYPNLRDYNSTTDTFYGECNNSRGSTYAIAPTSGVSGTLAAGGTGNVFIKHRLSTSETTTITVSGSSSTSVSSIQVNGVELMSGTSAASSTSSTAAANVAALITQNGFSATASGSTITITGPTSAADYVPVITQSGSMTLTPDVFPDTTASKLTNFANWYSYYRTRILMMKTAAGRAFSSLNNKYRVGLMKISSSTPVVYLDTFAGTPRDNWYNALYSMSVSGSTPLRTALSNAGRYYAGKLSGTDPIQYSCQQNFTILSTDGYWNSGDGYKIDGTTVMDNEDGNINTAPRPMYDGAQTGTTVTITYTRDKYSTSSCSRKTKQLQTQPEIGSCSVTVTGTPTGSESCTPSSWSNNGPATTSGSCSSSISLPSPNPTTPVEQSRVTTPGSFGGSSNSLADVAMYYYNTDLRTPALGNCTGAQGAGVDVCANNVFTTASDNNQQQHMTTFTLGLGASGHMIYSPSYLSDYTGDYVSVHLGSVADSTASPPICSWQADGTTCNWPLPGLSGSNGLIANIDDLWHAAVDGHGAYFSATNPGTLSTGLSNALTSINAKKGSAAAAATSTLNPVAGNNFAYVASYTTVTWNGNLEARGINVDTGVVDENATWCAEDVVAGSCASPSSVVSDTSGATTAYYCSTPNSTICNGGTLNGTDCLVPMATACTGTMKSTVSDISDTRTIYTANGTGTALVNFTYANLTAAQQSYFSAANIGTLTQWSTLTPTQQAAAAGVNLVNFLRGQYGYEDRTTNPVADRLYRYRSTVLGDAVESQPAFIAAPVFTYPYPGYSAYATAQAGRAGAVYMGTNDGMMHAFNATTGAENWAYVPSMVIPNMWKLADTSYVHANYVNGSPITSDICSANCTNSATAVWKTILVAGLNGGGRGYYALDITNPTAPTLLWEFTTTAGIGSVQDDDLGYTYGQPIITTKADGTWVVLVTSGYNNVTPGDGKGYLYVLNANTGAIISKIGTGVGSTTTPSGLAKIAGWNNEPAGNQAGYVYGGDLLGNVWRFDINGTTTAAIGTGDVMDFAELFSDSAGTQPQPVTTTPVLGTIDGYRVIFIGTGKYLETSDLSTTQVQTEYAIKDDNATATLVNPRNTLVNQTLINNPDGTATRISGTSNTVNFYTGLGWYVDFPDSGERVNIDSKLVLGTLLVPTIVPSNTACSPGGYGWLNYFDYQTGGAVNVTSGLTSSKYDSPIVGINVIYVQGEPKVGVVTSSNPTPTLNNEVPFKANAPTFTGKRVIWRELIP